MTELLWMNLKMIDPVIVFSKEKCDYCDKAKNLLSDKSLEFRELSLESDFKGDKEAFIAAISEKMPDGQEFDTVPQIFMGSRYIGGYTQLVRVIGE